MGGTQAAAKKDDSDREEQERPSNGGVVLSWCGDPTLVLEVLVDGGSHVPCWIQQSHGDLQVPMAAGQHEYCLRLPNGTTVWEGMVSVVEGEWGRVDVGLLFEKVTGDPQNRSQFSFDDGRSACSFLVCDAADLLSERLGGGGDELEIQGAEISEEHIAEVLTRGMKRYVDGPRDSFAAMGLEHTSVLEVLEFCGWVWNGEWSGAPDGTFWGSLAEDGAILDCLSQAVQSAKTEAREQGERGSFGGQRAAGRRSKPIVAALTRPPETVLLLLGSTGAAGDGLIGVLDTHTRSVGSKQYPASFYQCKSLGQLADLLRFTFFPLPQGMHLEELGTYLLFELNLLAHKRPGAAGAANPSAVGAALGCAPGYLSTDRDARDASGGQVVTIEGDDDELDPGACERVCARENETAPALAVVSGLLLCLTPLCPTSLYSSDG